MTHNHTTLRDKIDTNLLIPPYRSLDAARALQKRPPRCTLVLSNTASIPNRSCARLSSYFEDVNLLQSCPELRVNELSGAVARHLFGRHRAPKGERDDTDGTASGDPEDEFRRSV